jgi:hypothetical protein
MIRAPNRFTKWVQRHQFTPAEVAWLFNKKLPASHQINARLVRRWLRRSTADWAVELFPRLRIPSQLERKMFAALGGAR